VITVLDLQRLKRERRRFVMLTAYDALVAGLLDRAGITVLLVGDSLGMVVLGHETTIPVTLDQMVHHCQAVARGAGHALLVGDLPFLSYEVSVERAMEAAGRLLKEGGMHAVKLEGGAPVIDTVRRLTDAGIPVMGHLGLTPQRVHLLGGFKVQGRTPEAAATLLSDARALEAAGAFALVLEAVPPDLARTVTEALTIPTIGIGAGPHCDGQVLVFHDLVGLSARAPKFVKRYGDLATDIDRMVRRFAQEVADGAYPGPEHTYAAGPAVDARRENDG
jgi:3-methyl-2-oxobutanoate hydroxymethyltransferase